jgi:hypothetical protein
MKTLQVRKIANPTSLKSNAEYIKEIIYQNVNYIYSRNSRLI